MGDKRILLVDDEPYVVRSLSFVLRREGYDVETASDGEEALSKVDEFSPHVVFLDLMMPKLDGYEVCRILKTGQGYEGRRPYVVILTCKGQDVDRYKGFLEGADEYMNKPFSPAEVVMKMKGFFGRQG